MSLLFNKSGVLTTIQDQGRHRFRRFGINPNGVMDQQAARLINILVSNRQHDAVVEMHFPAPEILFEKKAIAAIGGGNFSASLNGTPIENWCSFAAREGDVLKFSRKISGNRSYLAVSGGVQTKVWLGSSSTNLAASVGGFEGRSIAAGDRLFFRRTAKEFNGPTRIGSSIIPRYSSFPTVRIIPGGEFEYLTAEGRNLVENQDFTISNKSDRMGFRFVGKRIDLDRRFELVSSAVAFGTVQLLPDGQLIVLMADHQTSGGYPRIGHVITADLPLLAQLGANDRVAFRLIEPIEAERLAITFERNLAFLKAGVALGCHGRPCV